VLRVAPLFALAFACTRADPAPPISEIRGANDVRLAAWFDGDPSAVRVVALLSTT